MRNIVYYVAASLDGFISGPDGDISGFNGTAESDGIIKYFDDLKNFDTVIMGRNTYEFGYKFGLKPGERAYPHMEHFVFSNSLQFRSPENAVKVIKPEIEIMKEIKGKNGTDIYLCGGGQFAGWLLDHGMIDQIIVKLNPIILSEGIQMFGSSKRKVYLELIESKTYSHGLQLIQYHVRYD